jgi:hypothetical protein
MRTLLKGTLRLVLGVVVVFVVLEGLANTALFWYTLILHPRAPLAEKGHTRYDPDLGWSNIPNVSLKDYYGPGLDLTTNAQGFRGTRPVDVAVPPGMLRIICSGDSMTLGYGVRDDQTWCQTLASLDPRIEAVNMGQGGYGVDQAYLWFKRDGVALEHQVHIFAFIVSDFNRMQGDSFYDYKKPVLVAQNGSLLVTNTPVPKVARIRPWLMQNLPSALDRLATVQIASHLVQPLGAARGDLYAGGNMERSLAVFEDLRRLNATKGSELMLVYLPLETEWKHRGTDKWRTELGAELRRRGFWYVDLVDELRAVPFWRTWELFIPPGAVKFVGATGHYTVSGHEWVAKNIFKQLLANREFAAKLSALPSVRPAAVQAEPGARPEPAAR